MEAIFPYEYPELNEAALRLINAMAAYEEKMAGSRWDATRAARDYERERNRFTALVAGMPLCPGVERGIEEAIRRVREHGFYDPEWEKTSPLAEYWARNGPPWTPKEAASDPQSVGA